MAEFSLGQYLPRAYLADHLSHVPETYGSGDWGQQLFRDSSGRHPVCVPANSESELGGGSDGRPERSAAVFWRPQRQMVRAAASR